MLGTLPQRATCLCTILQEFTYNTGLPNLVTATAVEPESVEIEFLYLIALHLHPCTPAGLIPRRYSEICVG